MVNMRKIGLGFIIPAAMLFTACNRTPATNSLTVSVVKSSMPAFYNITLNATHEDMKKAGFEYGDIVNIKVSKGERKKEYNVAYVTNYNEAGSFNKSLCDYEAKGDKLNISPGLDNKGFGDDYFEGGTCTITMKKKQGYAYKRNIAQVTTKLSFDECGKDNIMYSNFRDVAYQGNIYENVKAGVLFRGSSPFYAKKNPYRYAVADKLMQAFNINSEISLSVSEEKLVELFDEKTHPETQDLFCKELVGSRNKTIENRKFKTVNLGSDFFDKDPDKGNEKVKEVFDYMVARIKIYNEKKEETQLPKPLFYLHCDEGKDRTGFFVMLLEMLKDVSFDDLVSDFMKTFLNYYNISEINNKEKYDTMADLTCYRNLYTILMPVDEAAGETRIDKLAAIDLYNFDAKKECLKLINDYKAKGITLEEVATNYFKQMFGYTEEDEIKVLKDYFKPSVPNSIN